MTGRHSARPKMLVVAAGVGPMTAAMLVTVPPTAVAGVPQLSASVGAEHINSSNAWSTVMAAQPGERIKILLSYTNTTATVTQRDVTMRLRLPKGAYLNGAASLTNALHPAGTPVSGPALVSRGVRIGDYGPGANGYLTLIIRLPKPAQLRCGVTPLVAPLTETAGNMKATTMLSLHAHRDCPTSAAPVAAPGG